MDKGKIFVLVVFAGILGAAMAPLSRGGPAGAGGAVKAPPPKVAAASGQYRGISLPLHNPSPDHPYEQYIDEIADTGANTIMLTLAGFQENASSTSIFVDLRKVPGDEHIKRLIAHAHKRGLAVVLMPIVLLENPREGEWRGKINPTDWDQWWSDYQNFITHYAQIAAQAKVDIYMVGSELISTETQQDKWRGIIAEVRKLFGGQLGYSANWDHYKPVRFWDDLDIVAMTTYYDLTDNGKDLSLKHMLDTWAWVKQQVLEWQATVNRPILFTEVGWPNQVTCAEFPWDYTRSPGKPAPALQATCFESFLQTWADEPISRVAGYIVWEWRSYPEQEIDPNRDTSYCPMGKPAMKVIEKYFAREGNVASRPASRPDSRQARQEHWGPPFDDESFGLPPEPPEPCEPAKLPDNHTAPEPAD